MNILKAIGDIVQHEMELGNDQVWLYNEKIFIPKDERLYVSIREVSSKAFGNTRKEVATTSPVGLAEVLSVNMHAMLSVDLVSKSLEALERKEEVLMALKSNYAQQQQELLSFFIGTVSGFVNLSFIEGSSIPYRLNLSVPVQYFVSKTKQIDYYDTFSDELIEDA